MPRFLTFLFAGFLLLSVLSAQGADTSALMKKGAELEKSNKLEEAVKTYQEALQGTQTEDLYRKIGALLGKMQKYGEAETLIKEGMGKFPASTSLMNLMGFIKFKTGNQEAADVLWKEVLAKDPNNSFAKEWTQKVGKGSSSEKPETGTEKPATTEAKKPSSSSESSDPSNKESAFKVDESLPIEEQEKQANQIFQDMSQTDEAEHDTFYTYYRKIVEKYPKATKAPEACYRLSTYYMKEMDYEGAIKTTTHLINRYPDSPFFSEAKNRLLFCYKKTENHQMVVKLIGEMLQFKDQVPPGLLYAHQLDYGDALLALGKKEEAKAVFEELVQTKGNDEECDAAQVAKYRLSTM